MTKDKEEGAGVSSTACALSGASRSWCEACGRAWTVAAAHCDSGGCGVCGAVLDGGVVCRPASVGR